MNSQPHRKKKDHRQQPARWISTCDPQTLHHLACTRLDGRQINRRQTGDAGWPAESQAEEQHRLRLSLIRDLLSEIEGVSEADLLIDVLSCKISLRELARIQHVSPSTVSRFLPKHVAGVLMRIYESLGMLPPSNEDLRERVNKLLSEIRPQRRSDRSQ